MTNNINPVSPSKILVVDDDLDLEYAITRKFFKEIRDRSINSILHVLALKL
ncbi:MAG: hypothetical protein HC847_27105 [Hydrococcus sp. RU_2_2]|nr:hypothetical protein [Hydrococcus sp. RU_2_2]NJP22116.1 hypothetical protein [Hydrococcus sp. CRU_1_1]